MNPGRPVFAIIVLAAGVNAQWLRFGKYDDAACTRLIHEQYIQTSSSGICTITDSDPDGSYKATKGAGNGGGGGGGGNGKSLKVFTSQDCTGTGYGFSDDNSDEIDDTTCTRLDPGDWNHTDNKGHEQYVKVLNWNTELPTTNAIIIKMYHGPDADADICAADSVSGSHTYLVLPMGDESCAWMRKIGPEGKYVKFTTCDASTGDYTREIYSDNACAGTVDSTISESIGDTNSWFENKVCRVSHNGSTYPGEYESAEIDYCQGSSTSSAPGHSNFFPVVSVAALLSLLAL